MTDHVVEDLRRSIEALTVSFTEPIEYAVKVGGVLQARRAVRRYEGLLVQLEQNSITPLQSRTQGHGGGGKPGSRPPINEAYSNCVDTIGEAALTAWCMLGGRACMADVWSLELLLEHILATVEERAEDVDWHQTSVTIARMARKWVYDARVVLGYESRKVALADTVCGQCGGTLVVAFDATSDVRCVGTQDSDPCGTVYGRMDWVSLLGPSS